MLVLHRSSESAYPEETSLHDLMRLARDDRVTRYVKLLLLGMIARGEGSTTLDSESPLPPATHFGQQLPRFDLVADRIKQMAGLEPGPSATPREAEIDVDFVFGSAAGSTSAARPRRYRVFARFVDAPARSVYLHLTAL